MGHPRQRLLLAKRVVAELETVLDQGHCLGGVLSPAPSQRSGPPARGTHHPDFVGLEASQTGVWSRLVTV